MRQRGGGCLCGRREAEVARASISINYRSSAGAVARPCATICGVLPMCRHCRRCRTHYATLIAFMNVNHHIPQNNCDHPVLVSLERNF